MPRPTLFSLATECDTVNAEPFESDERHTDDVKTDVVEAISSLKNQDTEIEQETDDIVETVEKVDTLSKFTHRIAQGPEAFSVESIKIARVSIESIMKKLGIQEMRPIPAMECFENRFEQQQAYSVATEGLMEIVRNIWRAIKNAVVNLFRRIKEFFRAFFDTTKKLERYANKLKEKLKNPGKYPIEDHFDDYDIFFAFLIDDKFHPNNVVSILEAHADLTNQTERLGEHFSRLAHHLPSMLDVIKTMHEKLMAEEQKDPYEGLSEEELKTLLEEDDPERHQATLAAMQAERLKRSTESILNPTLSDDDKAFVASAKVFSDELKIILIDTLNLKIESEDETTVKAVSKQGYVFDRHISMVMERDDKEEDLYFYKIDLDIEVERSYPRDEEDILVLDVGQMDAIIASAQKLIKMQVVAGKAHSAVHKLNDELIKILNNVENMITHTFHRDTPDELRQLMTTRLNIMKAPINSIISAINRIYTTIPSTNIQAITLALEYVDESLKHYR